jgi:hypothetical protein
MKKIIRNSWLAVIAFAALIACKDDNVAPEISHFELRDTTIHVGNQLIIEAEIQSDQVFNYNWFLNNELKCNDAIFIFTPEKSGEYSLKLVVENKYGKDSIESLITVLPRLITIDFENLILGNNSFWNGSDGSGSFTSGIASFPNYYDQTYMYWEGFSYSNKNDTTTVGFTNQYSVYNSRNNGNKFGVFYPPFFGVSAIEFENKQLINLQSLKVCNITYPALSMLKGDTFAKKFGGTTGNDPDFLKLEIYGLDVSGHIIDTVNFYLADYRFANNSQDYIVNKWTEVDLTKLGAVNKISFSLKSSDNDPLYGMNTPAYFSLDDIVYLDPEK